MFSYYLKLGLLSIRRNPLLSALMIAAIAVGIGACMSIITVNYICQMVPRPNSGKSMIQDAID